ncbi:MAG TPA: dTDP-4-dehydrorhamnose reductase [Gammaproteobacteria bacterium]|nr:dTDP-4-dehydrorhamnose reductase [Gammaproteobacteria bacterium]
MRVLVAGAGGQVGRALMASVPQGCNLIAATRADLDITDPSAVAGFIEAHEPDVIVNAAAFTAVERAENEPERARLVNQSGAANLARAAAARKARMIQLSTDFVFDGSASAPYPPDAPPAPTSVYGRTKLAGEQAVRDLLPDASIVLRTAWVYAPHGRNFVLTMLKLMREPRPVRVVDDQVGTPTSAGSVARAVWAFAAEPALRGTYHWTDAGVASWHDFAAAIAEEAAACGLLTSPVDLKPVSSRNFPTAARRPAYSVLDTRSTAEALRMTPRHWRANLRDVLGEIALG